MAKQNKKIIVSVKPRKAKKTKEKSSQVGAIGQALRVLGGLGGGTVGAMLGHGELGRQAGSSLGAALSRWLGTGDYSVTSNSLVSRLKSTESVPMMHVNNQSVIIRHREFVGEVRGSTTFAIAQTHVLNPGLSASFPWLSAVANSFQEYKIRGMVYHYVPSSGIAVTGSSALGTVMIYTSYRSNDSPPGQKVELLNEYFASESVPSESFCHPIECDPKENPFNIQYVRAREVPAGDNRLLYDHGVTYVATSGQQSAGTALGDLWVTYEVELKKPIVTSNVTARDDAFVYAAAWLGGGSHSGMWPTPPAGTTVVNYGMSSVSFTGSTVTFAAGTTGRYSLTWRYYADGNFNTTTYPVGVTPTNCVTYNPYNGAGVSSNLYNPRTVADGIDEWDFHIYVDLDAATRSSPSTVLVTTSPTIVWSTGLSYTFTVTRIA